MITRYWWIFHISKGLFVLLVRLPSGSSVVDNMTSQYSTIHGVIVKLRHQLQNAGLFNGLKKNTCKHEASSTTLDVGRRTCVFSV
ncbi:hypothetical protein EDD36DRAFT_433585 [Exophiala viscosa]|uniref:Secreted protein n=1 Tax=Exophiala viscosa TaxID=2486360 RepID=A0AAN6IFP3_9EURO|nr:hypothetical protein EDD36DRAFT_433585 [Exophiala viscosa]